MFILEIFFALLLIAVVLFGKLEFSKSSFKLSILIAGRSFPLVSVVRKNDSNGNNVSI